MSCSHMLLVTFDFKITKSVQARESEENCELGIPTDGPFSAEMFCPLSTATSLRSAQSLHAPSVFLVHYQWRKKKSNLENENEVSTDHNQSEKIGKEIK